MTKFRQDQYSNLKKLWYVNTCHNHERMLISRVNRRYVGSLIKPSRYLFFVKISHIPSISPSRVHNKNLLKHHFPILDKSLDNPSQLQTKKNRKIIFPFDFSSHRQSLEKKMRNNNSVRQQFGLTKNNNSTSEYSRKIGSDKNNT